MSQTRLSAQFLTVCKFSCSIAGSSATIYAYLGEFHSSTNRSKVLMAASFIYGLSCNYMPILGFLVLNRTFHYHIPLFNIAYKPWRFYLLSCGLPSLVCAIVLLFIPESPKFTFSKVRKQLRGLVCLVSCKHVAFPGQRGGNVKYFKTNLSTQQPQKQIRLRRHEGCRRLGVH